MGTTNIFLSIYLTYLYSEYHKTWPGGIQYINNNKHKTLSKNRKAGKTTFT